MDDFPGLLSKDFGIKPQGKSATMAPPTNPDYTFRSDSIFDDDNLYSGPPKYSSESRATAARTSSYDYDSLFNDSSKPPVFDKPVYDDDLFDGLPGVRSSSKASVSAAEYDNVFGISDKSPNSSPFDDLLGNLGRKEAESKPKNERMKAEKDAPFFDDLLPGFGRSTSPVSSRSTSDAAPQKPSSNSSKTDSNFMKNPFHVQKSTSDTSDLSSGLFADPLEEITKLNVSGKSRVSYVNEGLFDDIDPLEGLGKSVPLSSETNKRGTDRSPLRTASGSQIPARKEPNDEDFEHYTKKRMPSMDNFPEFHQPVFDMPSMSTGFHSSVGQTSSPPPYSNLGSNETSSQVIATPRSEENFDRSDDVWLTVSEIPLFTQPTSAPPPSRPPPPRPPQVLKSATGSFSSTNAKKVNDYYSFPNSAQYSDSPHSARAAAGNSVTSPIDELEDFAMGRNWNNVEQAEIFPGDDFETNSVAAASAAASAAAMKEAMDRAEAKFRHAKGMRERENLKAARNKESGIMDKDERAMQDALDREVREKHERLERERQQREREEEERQQRRQELEREREEKEREQRRLEKEREQERARQAVQRATREARERAAAEARARAERVAVEKVGAEARERAERAAVQRAQAEARQRAASEARERAERAAAEVREREAREKEAKVGAEARLRAERAAAEARERAAASARANQQKNDDDLESFFSMGSRPSSAPRSRADPMFDGQNKGGPEAPRGTSVGSSSSMRKASSSANIVDDLSSIFGAAASSSGEFQEVDGETEERRRARLERQQRTQERAAKALAEKNQRDLNVQKEQAERHRIGETLDVEIKRWAAGKEGNLRALLSTMQYVLWPACGWQPVSLTDLITPAAVKKAYRKATLCIHPDKVQQKGANLQQKYVAEKVFDLLKEAWNKFNSEELF